jgi:geranylgeranyl pyrophosphate synthase
VNSAIDLTSIAQVSPRRDFDTLLAEWRLRVDRALTNVLPPDNTLPQRLHEAMRYAVLGGGKRVRPILAYATGRALGLADGEVDPVACAVELIHAYSLVHDDLPAMDDDDLRRGRPTCHVAFDEATAVLVGDALQPLAFHVLVSGAHLAVHARVRLVELLAEAAGSLGMAGGQALDLAAQGRRLGLADVEALHSRKTGALIRASVCMAAACAPRLRRHLKSALEHFAIQVGLAFQIQDDLLDLLGDSAVLGKSTGADQRQEKSTYPAAIGIEASQQRLRTLHAEALEALEPFGVQGAPLRHVSQWLLARVS